jgi:hypothetical protein
MAVCAESEVVIAVTMKISIFWDALTCGTVEVYRRFG